MSVSIKEVLNNAGFNFNNIDDCKWLLSQCTEFAVMCSDAQELLDLYDDYQDCKETAEDDGDYNYPSFQEWLKLKKETTNE